MDADGLPPFSAGFREAYTGLRLLGAGGMAQVFRAHQKALDRPVAIKVIRSLDRDERARFDREARALAALSHPNVVRVFESGVDGDLAFLVMELVEGETVESRHQRQPLAQHEALAVADGIAQALEYAHGRGLVHRDVKPANVFLTRDGAVKLGDFGLARTVAHGATITNPSLVMGTPQFMAPEQVTGAKSGPAVDQYALGVVIYFLLSGDVPHQNAHLMEMLADRARAPARPLENVPGDLAAVVARMLATSPEDRFASMTQVRAALAPLLSPRQVTQATPRPRVRSSSSVTRVSSLHVAARSPSVRNRTAGAVAAMIALGALGFALSPRAKPPVRKPSPSPVASVAAWPAPGLTLEPVPVFTTAVRQIADLRSSLASAGGNAAIGAARTRTGVDLGPHREYWSGWFLLDEWLESAAPGTPPPRISTAHEGQISPFDFILHHDNMAKWTLRKPASIVASALNIALYAPDDWRPWLFLGRLLERERRHEAARRVYRHALSLPHPCDHKEWPAVLGEGLVSAILATDQPVERAVDLAHCAARQDVVWRAVTAVLWPAQAERLEAALHVTLKRPGMQAAAGLQLARLHVGSGRLLEAEEALRAGIDAGGNDDEQRTHAVRAFEALVNRYYERGRYVEAAELQGGLLDHSDIAGVFAIVHGPDLPPVPEDDALVQRDRVRLGWAYRLCELGRGAEADHVLAEADRAPSIHDGSHVTIPAMLATAGCTATWIEPSLVEQSARYADRAFTCAELAGLLVAPSAVKLGERVLAAEEARDPGDVHPRLARALAAARLRRNAEAAALLAGALGSWRAGQVAYPVWYEVAFRPAWRALIDGQTELARSMAKNAYASLPRALIASFAPQIQAIFKPLAQGDFEGSARACEEWLTKFTGHPIWWLVPVWHAAAKRDRKALDEAAARARMSLRYQIRGLWVAREIRELTGR